MSDKPVREQIMRARIASTTTPRTCMGPKLTGLDQLAAEIVIGLEIGLNPFHLIREGLMEARDATLKRLECRCWCGKECGCICHDSDKSATNLQTFEQLREDFAERWIDPEKRSIVRAGFHAGWQAAIRKLEKSDER